MVERTARIARITKTVRRLLHRRMRRWHTFGAEMSTRMLSGAKTGRQLFGRASKPALIYSTQAYNKPSTVGLAIIDVLSPCNPWWSHVNAWLVSRWPWTGISPITDPNVAKHPRLDARTAVGALAAAIALMISCALLHSAHVRINSPVASDCNSIRPVDVAIRQGTVVAAADRYPTSRS